MSQATPARAAAAADRRPIRGSVYVLLKPLSVRKISSDEVIARLRPQLAQFAGGTPVPANRSGHPRRRPAVERAVSVHAAGGQGERSERMGAEAPRGPAGKPGDSGRQFRSAAKRSRDRCHLRPRHGRAPRAHRERARQHALRCLRPAPGIHHLQCAQSISRHHGSRAALLAEPAIPRRHLREHIGRRGDRHANLQLGDGGRRCHLDDGHRRQRQRGTTAAGRATPYKTR